MMWGNPYFGSMMAGMAIWSVVWLVIVGLLIWALVRWVSSTTSAPGGPASNPSALEILRQRYARGEIDATTFEQMRERLESSRQDQGAPTPR